MGRVRLSESGTWAAPRVNTVTPPGRPRPGSDVWVLTLALLRFGSDTSAARAFRNLDPPPGPADSDALDRLAEALGLSAGERAGRIVRAVQRADEALRRAERAKLVLIPWFHAEYPPLLHEIADPPIAIWCAGTASCLTEPAVAIVGSRRATPAGAMVAHQLAAGLAGAGLVVVSGLARGIDATAHRAALEAGGRSIAVLGSGGDRTYPPEHAGLAERLVADGVLVTEFPPGTPPLAHHFPLRNRIISGLCRAVVVVEASERSGSLITARTALEQGREVLAVPGSVASGRYSGCHALIKDGAALVETVEDVLWALRWDPRPRPDELKSDKTKEVSQLEAAMAVGEPYRLEDLVARTGLDSAALLAALGALEVEGRVRRLPGAGFVRFDRSVIGGGDG
jgi:DNA processing protein